VLEHYTMTTKSQAGLQMGSERIGGGSRVQSSGVTWRHESRDHWIPHRPFPIDGPRYLMGRPLM